MRTRVPTVRGLACGLAIPVVVAACASVHSSSEGPRATVPSSATGAALAPRGAHAPFVPTTERRGDRAVLRVTFPDGTRAVLTYPRTLSLARMGVQPDVSYLYRGNPARRVQLVFVRKSPSETLLVGRAPLARYVLASGKRAELWRAGSREHTGSHGTRYWLVFGARGWIVHAAVRTRAAASVLARSVGVRQTGDGFVVVSASPPIALSDESGEGEGPRLTIGDRDPRPDFFDADRFRFVQLWVEKCLIGSRELAASGEYATLCLSAGAGRTISVEINGHPAFVRAVFRGLASARR